MARHPERSQPSRAVRGSAIVPIVSFALALAGCTGIQPAQPSGDAVPTVGSPSASPSRTAAEPAPEPTLVPDGTAYDNLPLFTAVTEQVWASPDQVSGRAYIDALVAAGFDKAAMQVTADLTTIGNPVESIMFSVQWDEECLIGQVGPTTGDPVTTVMAVVPDDGCLIGNTRPIDW